MNQHHFGWKRDSRYHSTTSFNKTFTITKTSYQILKVLSFRYFNSFNKNSRVNLSAEKKKQNETFWGVHVSLFVRIREEKKRKIRKSNLVFVVILLLESKGLYTLTNKLPFHNFKEKKGEGVTFVLPYEQRFLCCRASSVYEAVRVA